MHSRVHHITLHHKISCDERAPKPPPPQKAGYIKKIAFFQNISIVRLTIDLRLINSITYLNPMGKLIPVLWQELFVVIHQIVSIIIHTFK